MVRRPIYSLHDQVVHGGHGSAQLAVQVESKLQKNENQGCQIFAFQNTDFGIF
jgi:hypothetical protein